jgi:hypothetical protein
MLAKKTVKNQITLPKKIADLFPDTDYFEVQVKDGTIILKPVQPDRLAQLHDKLSNLGITEKDIRDAIVWAREKKA